MKRHSLLSYTVVFVLVFIADRITKFFALQLHDSRYDVNPFLSFDLVFNRGVSWSMLYFHDDARFFLVTGLVMAITCLVTWVAYQRWQAYKVIIGEILVLAGGISNIIDRFIYRGVIDFIVLSYNDWVFPAFNIADVAIVFGVLCMGVIHFYESSK